MPERALDTPRQARVSTLLTTLFLLLPVLAHAYIHEVKDNENVCGQHLSVCYFCCTDSTLTDCDGGYATRQAAEDACAGTVLSWMDSDVLTLGDAFYSLNGDTLTYWNIGESGHAGASFEILDSWNVAWEWFAYDVPSLPDSAELTVTLAGPADTLTNHWLGDLSVLKAGGIVELSFNGFPLGSSTYTYEVYSGDDLVGSVTGATGPATAEYWPEGAEAYADSGEAVEAFLQWGEDRNITLPAGGAFPTAMVFQGDELRIVPEGQTVVVQNMNYASVRGRRLAFLRFWRFWFRYARISGRKFDDLNANGVRDLGEPGIGGWTIQLRQAPAASPTATRVTKPNGVYRFLGLAPGTYFVSEVPQAGWAQTAPATVTYQETVALKDRRRMRHFGNAVKCPQTQLTAIGAGNADDFSTADGSEPSSPSGTFAPTLTVCSSGPLTQFDQQASNQCFGHTFTGWPTTDLVQDATLCFRIKGVGGSNDAINLWEDTAYGWTMQFQDFVPGWTGNDTALVCLNLDNLPVDQNGVTSVLALLQDGDLDIRIADDTAVDFMNLYVYTCQDSTVDTTVVCLPTNPALMLQDTFTVNETDYPFGTFNFDTTTAHVKTGLNIAPDDGSEGVILGDTLVCCLPFGSGTRADLVFRILPGPGSYSTPGDVNSGLIERDVSHPFWATYLASPGPFSKGSHDGGTKWDASTWNTARMDTAEISLVPIVNRDIGIPVEECWKGALHESDPNFPTLGIMKDRCFLVNPAGPVDNSNICCSAVQCAGAPFFESYPPASYNGGVDGSPNIDWYATQSQECTKILPDGYFTPGTHIEYFVRRSDALNPFANVRILPDTNFVVGDTCKACNDQSRWLEMDVLPDRWKASMYGGLGDACMLVIDAADCTGEEPAWYGALDTLGFGKLNGASRGWFASTVVYDINDPANFVYPNLGQAGLHYDKYDIRGVQVGEGGHPGCRLAVAPPALYPKQCTAGPTPAVLLDAYPVVIWMQGEIPDAMHDGVAFGRASDDVALLENYLLSSSLGVERGLWLNGDDVVEDLWGGAGAGPSLIGSLLGTLLIDPNYAAYSTNAALSAKFDPIAAPFSTTKTYGIDNSALRDMDVVDANPAELDAVSVAEYENVGANGPYYASVYRETNAGAGRYYRTLADGFKFSALRDESGGAGADDFGRLRWMKEAIAAFGCIGTGGIVAVGDTPGQGEAFVNFLRGAYPNPARSSGTTINFTLEKAMTVTLRVYNVAGRLVHETQTPGQRGGNEIRWRGESSLGIPISPGVYFYRLSAPDAAFLGNNRRVVILSSAAR